MKKTMLLRVLCVVLWCVVVVQMTTWGYLIARHLLSVSFGVPVESTWYEVLIGIIAIVGSFFVLVSSVSAWRGSIQAAPTMLIGGGLFVAKNILDVINEVARFAQFAERTPAAIDAAATSIGVEALQFLFWLFILWYFSRRNLERLVQK